MIKTVTREMERAEADLDAFGSEAFPLYHGMTDGYEHSLETLMSREFDVCQLMYGLGIELDPEYGYEPGPVYAKHVRNDYEAVCAIVNGGEWNDSSEASEFPEVIEAYGAESVDTALSILSDSCVIGDLTSEYFALESVSQTNAEAQLKRYMELLDIADRAYRAAGWEL